MSFFQKKKIVTDIILYTWTPVNGVSGKITQRDLLWEILKRKKGMAGRYSVPGSALPGTGPIFIALKVSPTLLLVTFLYLLRVRISVKFVQLQSKNIKKNAFMNNLGLWNYWILFELNIDRLTRSWIVTIFIIYSRATNPTSLVEARWESWNIINYGWWKDRIKVFSNIVYRNRSV